VKLKKAFEHHGKAYKEGDEYEGPFEELVLLSRQGYCDPPEAEKEEEEKPSESHKHNPPPPPEPPKKTR
jgi:hypothetical protein